MDEDWDCQSVSLLVGWSVSMSYSQSVSHLVLGISVCKFISQLPGQSCPSFFRSISQKLLNFILRNAIWVPVGKIQSCFTIKVGGNQGTLSFSFLLFLVFLVIFSFTEMQFIVKENSPSQVFDTGITLSALNWTCHRWLFLDFILFFLEEKGTFTYFITWSLVWHITRNWRNIPLSFIRSTSKFSNWF